MDQYLAALVNAVRYQLIGVGIFLPLELALPKTRLTFPDRARGILLLLATAPFVALVTVALTGLQGALGIEPILHFNHSFGSPILASIALALFIDLQFYTVHRLQHRFCWRFHAVHHSIRNLSSANSFHHWTEPLWRAVTIAIPLMFVEVQIGPTLGFLTFLFAFQQFFIHSSGRIHLGPFKWLLIDNRYHRIHHSTEREHHDTNFGAMTPLWDWLFGTLHMPVKDEWPEVGLAEIEEPSGIREWASLPWRLGNEGQRRIRRGPDEAGLAPLDNPRRPVV